MGKGAFGFGGIKVQKFRSSCSKIILIIRSCIHIENKLCALDAFKYVIFIPQFTNNELGKSTDVTFPKWHVVMGRAFLDHAQPLCICVHPPILTTQVCTKPILLLSFQVQVREKVEDSLKLLGSSFSRLWQRLLMFKDATLIYLAQFFRYSQWMLSLTFLFIRLFRSFVLRPF